MYAELVAGAWGDGAPLGLHALWAMLGIGAAVLVLVRAWWRSGSARVRCGAHRHPRHRCRRVTGLLTAQRGSATLEFAMVFPLVLGLVLVMLQTALVMGGQLFVHYAAFAATRSAIVHIPADRPGEGHNEIVIGATEPDSKFAIIRRAAVLAVMPVSGEWSADASEGEPIDTQALTEALADYFHAHGQMPPRWITDKVPARLRYAQANTEITLLDAEGELADREKISEREPITVRVRHRLNLSIPYARAVFSDGRHTQGGAYTVVEAQTTLTNEGLDPTLPDPPVPTRYDQLEDDE